MGKKPRKGLLGQAFGIVAMPVSKPYGYAKKKLGKYMGYHIAMSGWDNDKPIHGSTVYSNLKEVFNLHKKKLPFVPLAPWLLTPIVADIAKAVAGNQNNSRLLPQYDYDIGTSDMDAKFVPDDRLKARLQASTSLATARSTTRTALKLVGMYWTKSGGKEFLIASSLTATTLVMSKLTVDTSVDISYWNRDFINLLTHIATHAQDVKAALASSMYGDPSNFPSKEAMDLALGPKVIADPDIQKSLAQFNAKLLTEFPILVGKYLVTAITAFTSAQHLALRWRTWITGKITNEWLKYKAAYKLKHGYTGIDNPDQRIQEDLDSITDFTVSITTEGMQSVLTLGAFLPILWSMGSFNPAFVGGPDINIPGFMTWAAVGYAALGTGILWGIAHNLPGIRRRKQATEGTFRAGLRSVHEQSEQIALSGGEKIEKALLKEQFGGKDGTTGVVGVSREYINKRKQMITFNAVHGNLGSLVPYIAGIPQVASAIINYGQLSQAAMAFRQVEGSVSFFMNNTTAFAASKANVDRLGQLLDGTALARYEEMEKNYYAKQKSQSAPTPSV